MSEQKITCLYVTFTGLQDPLGQSQVLPYIEDLSKKGIAFYLVSLEKTKDLAKIKELKSTLKARGVHWYPLRYFKHHKILMMFNIMQCFLVSFYLMLFKKITIIHARSYPPLFSVLLIKKICKVKIIFDMRGFWPEELVDSGRIKNNSIYYKTLKFLEKKSILSSDWIIALTPEAQDIIKNNYPSAKLKTSWMPTCVDEDKFEFIKPVFFNNKFVMVYSGSLWSFYNMPAMMDFFIALKSKIKNAHFLILANNETEKLHDLFLDKKIKKEEYTILTLKPEDVAKYLVGSNLAISFIYDTYAKKASFPTKIAEYLMSGLPVVINAQTNFLKEIVNENKLGVVLDAFNKESFEKVLTWILMLLQDKNIQERCKTIAQKYLGKQVCVNQYLDIYKKLG